MLYVQCREMVGREASPTACVIDNQSVKSAEKGADALGRRATLAWLNRCRRLAKDFENLSRNALAFLQLASIRLMLRKLCNPA